MSLSPREMKALRNSNLTQAVEHERRAGEHRRFAAEYEAQIAAEEEREAKAKEWPQEGDHVFALAGEGIIIEARARESCAQRSLDMGLLQPSNAEAELVRDFLRSRPRGWLLAMAKLGKPNAFVNHVGALIVSWHGSKLTALTDDERAALLGQG